MTGIIKRGDRVSWRLEPNDPQYFGVVIERVSAANAYRVKMDGTGYTRLIKAQYITKVVE